MIEEDARFLHTWVDEVGPTLRGARDLLEKMTRVPACAACPAARWYRLENQNGLATLECFCTEFRGVMFDGRRVITHCDGREDALHRNSLKSDDES